MKIEIELPEIEGFSYTGEHRVPKEEEWFIDLDGSPFRRGSFIPEEDEEDKYLILRKLKPKREFKDGAFYPAIMSGFNVCVYADTHTYDKVIFWINQDRMHLSESAFSWIGPELVIEWGEG